MWNWIKSVFMAVSDFLKPLLVKMMTSVGKLMCAVAVDAVKQVASNPSLVTWQQKQQAGVDIIVTQMTQKGFQLGVDFFLNEVIASISAVIAKNYEEGK